MFFFSSFVPCFSVWFRAPSSQSQIFLRRTVLYRPNVYITDSVYIFSAVFCHLMTKASKVKGSGGRLELGGVNVMQSLA